MFLANGMQAAMATVDPTDFCRGHKGAEWSDHEKRAKISNPQEPYCPYTIVSSGLAMCKLCPIPKRIFDAEKDLDGLTDEKRKGLCCIATDDNRNNMSMMWRDGDGNLHKSSGASLIP